MHVAMKAEADSFLIQKRNTIPGGKDKMKVDAGK